MKLTVKSAIPGRVGLWDRDPEYPGGEIYITDDPVEVEVTDRVREALSRGQLVEVRVKPKAASDEVEPKLGAKVPDEDAELKPRMRTSTEFSAKVAKNG